MEKTAVRFIFKIDFNTYMEQIVVLSGEDESLVKNIENYATEILELNSSWEYLKGGLCSRTSELKVLHEKAVIWQVFYESELNKEQFYERKYGKHS